MRQAAVYRNNELAAILTEESSNHFILRYEDSYFANPAKAAISLTLPKIRQEYHADSLFPFFFNMLSEGVNRKLQSRLLNIDEKDHFGLLLVTAGHDTIGSITVKPWGA
jgi:serine/threonine-protein kinase HipA